MNPQWLRHQPIGNRILKVTVIDNAVMGKSLQAYGGEPSGNT